MESEVGRLSGKRAIVTGAGSGIGRASAQLFAAQGARVLVVDQSEEGIEETLALILSEGHDAIGMKADVSDETDVSAYVARAVDTFGGLDVIYANAGVSGGRVPLFEQTVEQWEMILRVNLIGVFLAVKHASRVMVSQGSGAVICTASVAALRANAGSSPYAASKAGVVSFVQTAANELSGTGVRINAICPGLIETGMTRPIFDLARGRGTLERVGQLNPVRRHGEPSEIAHVALFLASDDASYVNGQSIPVDGGLSSTHPFVLKR
ncbi:MAG: NAD(P)-dependent dehydrogenase (short-subunit alcohol dehydrogenase family) [Gammaproteobacteria bacterium]|jgi:NAD(P)-dependent dehydrogenase (short-subunit alcohol dehydrogenase family)